jgi:hypothetical protein
LATPIQTNDSDKKAHPWRRCPMGKHLVRKHEVHIPPSKKHPNGFTSVRHEHCAENRSHKDELSFDEIQYISNTYFSSLVGPPTPHNLVKEFEKADDYDIEIRGWAKYWNDIFRLDDPLDPNLVKALIATESSFDIVPKRTIKTAHGLMQITNKTHRYLRDTKIELKDYLVVLTLKQLLDPSANICSGVRWLFRKKETASSKLKRKATWINAIQDYKGYLDLILDNQDYNDRPMNDLDKFYKILQENKNENKNSASLLLIDSII